MFPECRSRGQDVGLGFCVPTATCAADATACEVAKKRKVALNGVEEMREGPGSDVKKRLNCNVSDGVVDVDMAFFGGF